METVTAYIWVAHSGEGRSYIAVPQDEATFGMKKSMLWRRWGRGTIPGTSEKIGWPVLVAEASKALKAWGGSFTTTFGPEGFRADDGNVVAIEIDLDKLKE